MACDSFLVIYMYSTNLSHVTDAPWGRGSLAQSRLSVKPDYGWLNLCIPVNCTFSLHTIMPIAKSRRRTPHWHHSLSWAWYNKVSSFNVENLFVKKREPGPQRTVFVNEGLPDDYYDKKGRAFKERIFVTNQVITSKYTFVTFLPRNLLEQFRRIANM